MLNNSAASQGDNFPGLGYSHYGQNMTSALNNPQTGYAASSVHTKRQGQALHQQSQLQPGLTANARRTGQRQAMPAPYAAQYQQGRGGIQLPASNAPMIRPNQAALQSQYQLSQGGLATRGNLQQSASTAASVRALGQPGHTALSQMNAVHGDVSYGTQGHHVSQRFGLQQPPAHLQQEHQQRAHASVANNRFDLSSVQQPAPTSTPGSMYVHHGQHMTVSDAYRARPNAPPTATAQARRVLQARTEHPTGDKESFLDSSDFPTLGGLPNRAAGTAGQVDAAANGISNISIHGNLHIGKGNGPLDSNDFPALNTNRLPNSYMMQSAASTRTAQNEAPAPVATNDSVGAGRTAQADPREEADIQGLKGLLPHIRNENPCETYTALGGDLSSLGLDLSSSEPLYLSLSSPWAVGGRMGEVEIQLPHWFLFDPPNFKQLSLSRMSLSSIFNIFYIFAGEDQQLLAAEELHNREWLFHRTCLIWIKPKKMVKSVHDRLGEGEQGDIDYFDITAWAVKTKSDFFLDRRCIEESPSQFSSSHRQSQR